MFIKAKDYERFLIKFKVEVGEFFGLKNEDAFIVFRELDTFNTLKLKESYDKGETGVISSLKELLPNAIVEHNFYVDENTKMTNEQVIELIYEKTTLTNKVVGDFISNSFQLPK